MAGISEKLIEEGRAALRFTHNKYDGEIAGIIAAAKADLSLHGILAEKVEDEDDALVKRAIMNYSDLTTAIPKSIGRYISRCGRIYSCPMNIPFRQRGNKCVLAGSLYAHKDGGEA